MEVVKIKKGKGLRMKYGNSKVAIGSKMFPLSNLEKVSVWSSDNTQKAERNSTIIDLMNQLEEKTYNFQSGRCYTNTEYFQHLADELGVNVKSYSGWLFVGGSMPIHHAWNVLDDKIIIDTSVNALEALKDFAVEQMSSSNPNITQDEIRKMLVEIRKFHKDDQTGKSCVWGEVPPHYLYFGTEEKGSLARKRFRNLMDKYPEHPSYVGMVDKSGASKTQKMMIEEGLLKV